MDAVLQYHQSYQQKVPLCESERAQRVVENVITSPMGHGTLESLALVPARALRRLAEEWRAKHGDGEE